MKVKAIQIAQKLGISKATVSLALNDKPGVNKETRRKILECKEELESFAEEKKIIPRRQESIKVIMATKGMEISVNSEIDLWTDVMRTFEKEAKKYGYQVMINYVDVRNESLEELVKQYNQEETAGIILQATELSPDEISVLENIRKPMVIYDNESVDATHHSVIADNQRGVSKAVSCLMDRGYKNIVYLANDQEIYNFKARREAFCNAILQYNGNPYKEGIIVPLGHKIETAYLKMQHYLKEHELPDAFLMENYQVTIGVIRALQEAYIEIPDKLALIGIDTLPAYMTGNMEVTSVKIPHSERAALAMTVLRQEMEEPVAVKSRILTECNIVEGETVSRKGYS